MKKLLLHTPFLIAALLLWTTVPVASQSFSVAATSAEGNGDLNGYIPVKIMVTNNTSSTLNLRVAITERGQLPAGWQTQICFFLNCYPPERQEVDGELEANGSEELDITFMTDENPGKGCVEVTVTNLDNTSEKQVLTFCATAGTTSRSSAPAAGSISLEQNYPNPFSAGNSGTTKISYFLPSASPVTLKVYNLLGREVRTLVSEMRSAGKSTAIWDGHDNAGRSVPPGVYLYKLTTNRQTISRRMLYTR